MNIIINTPQINNIKAEIAALSEALAQLRILRREEEHEISMSAPAKFATLFTAALGAYIVQKRREGYLFTVQDDSLLAESMIIEINNREGWIDDSNIAELCGKRSDCVQTMQYTLGELLDNIADHARVGCGALAYSANERFSLTVADAGISIPSAYREAGIPIDNDCHALKQAFNGVSTKAREERGRGLLSITGIATRGLSGTITLLSGGGLLSSAAGQTECSQSLCYWQGTIVHLTGTLPQEKLNIYDYV